MLENKITEFTGKDVVRLVVVLFCLRTASRTVAPYFEAVHEGIARALIPHGEKLLKKTEEKNGKRRVPIQHYDQRRTYR